MDKISETKISERIQQRLMSAETEKNDNSLPSLPNNGREGLLVRVSGVEKKRSDNYQKNPYSYE